MNDLLKTGKYGLLRFGSYVRENWITVGMLAVSATQTYTLVSVFAPGYAFWLPALGVMLMEGGFLYWKWREQEADPLEDGKPDTNEQEKIANIMVYVTLFVSIVTMLAGLFVEIANSEIAYYTEWIVYGDMNVGNALAVVSMAFIFLLGAGHLFADWQYKKNDPQAILEREWRIEARALARSKRQADIEGQKIIMRGRNNELRRLYGEQGEALGALDATDEFRTIANPTKGGNSSKQ